MEKKLKIKVYTPAGLALENEAVSVIVPCRSGTIGILPNCAKNPGPIGSGVLEFKTPDGQVNQRLISGGFCNHVDDGLVILADTVALA